MSKARDTVLIQLGFMLIIYALAYNLVEDASDTLPKCRVYHEWKGVCTEWEKTPGRSVIQDRVQPGK